MKTIQRLPTYAEVLHYAADYCLWEGDYYDSPGTVYSCESIREAVIDIYHDHYYKNTLGNRVVRFVQWHDRADMILSWLRKMGLDTYSSYEFDSFYRIDERQGARYLWLKFAALVAEEESK